MSARPPKTPPESPPPVLLWGGAGMVAVVVHLMVVQQGLAAMGNVRAAAPPELPLIEVMAVASTVQGQDQPIENARPVTSEALRPQTAADRLAAASPSAERAQTAQSAAAVAARPVAPSAAPVPRLAAPIPAAPTPAAPAVAPNAAAASPQSATQPDAAERLAALVAPSSPVAPAPPSVQAPARLAPSTSVATVARPAATAPRQPGLNPVLTNPDSKASVAARPAAPPASVVGATTESAPRAAAVATAAPVASVAGGAERVAAVTAPAPASASSQTAAAPPAPASLAPSPVSPAPAPIAPTAVAPSIAPVPSLPPPATVPEREGIAAPLPESAPEAPANENTYDAVLDHLAEMPQPECFAALPSLSDEGRFQLEVFAKDAADLTEFRNRLEGFVGQRMPNTTMKPISAAQCEVMGFLTGGPSYPRFKLFFDIPRRVIQSGESLEGRIGNTSGGFITFLVIDDEGTVQDLATFLQFVPGGARFSIPLSLTAGPVETQQLLLVMSTRARLRTVELHNGTKADSFFPMLAAELRERGQTEDVALVAFSVR